MDSSDDDLPLSRWIEVCRKSEIESNDEIDIEADSDSEFLPEKCGTLKCRYEADQECETCNMALCSEHAKNTNCQNNHKQKVIPQMTEAKQNCNKESTPAAEDLNFIVEIIY